mmetsp:Transcript_41001/g.80874  ORF Transcript_41001/g.80874 Transcript_41001/m.80874 type:complete len:153 (+) Transcript_41001:484-942(+)
MDDSSTHSVSQSVSQSDRQRRKCKQTPTRSDHHSIYLSIDRPSILFDSIPYIQPLQAGFCFLPGFAHPAVSVGVSSDEEPKRRTEGHTKEECKALERKDKTKLSVPPITLTSSLSLPNHTSTFIPPPLALAHTHTLSLFACVGVDLSDSFAP